jgi:hypothetical protein
MQNILLIMPQKNIRISILRKFEAMPSMMFNYRFIIALVCAALLLLSGCKKALEDIPDSTLQGYFETNILNKDFVVDMATDSSVDKTSLYAGYTFVLTRTTSYTEGPMTGTKDGVVYTGTWVSNADYSQLAISLNTPSIPTEFIFLNRVWRFTKKSLPIMELAPYGSTDPKVLYMRRLQ